MIGIARTDPDIEVLALEDLLWQSADVVSISSTWGGGSASEVQRSSARMLWSESYLYARFETRQSGPIVANDQPVFSRKSMGLWEKDVCEIFIAPDRNEPRKYFEFEIAPTGEWLDLAIDMTSGERVTDWDYHSGMEVAARIENDRVLMSMKIPWEAFGRKPKQGDVWLGNIFRCVGKEPDRGYLAWRPTMTEKPNFHVPEAFGEFVFVE